MEPDAAVSRRCRDRVGDRVRVITGQRSVHSPLATRRCLPKDADGSAKVAIIGIERSAAAWAALLSHFPDLERSILQVLATLKHLLKQVDASFPNARSFLRPGFEKTDDFDP